MSIQLIQIKKKEVCDCVESIKELIKKSKYADTVECTNQGFIFNNESPHSASTLLLSSNTGKTRIRKIKVRLIYFSHIVRSVERRLLNESNSIL